MNISRNNFKCVHYLSVSTCVQSSKVSIICLPSCFETNRKCQDICINTQPFFLYSKDVIAI